MSQPPAAAPRARLLPLERMVRRHMVALTLLACLSLAVIAAVFSLAAADLAAGQQQSAATRGHAQQLVERDLPLHGALVAALVDVLLFDRELEILLLAPRRDWSALVAIGGRLQRHRAPLREAMAAADGVDPLQTEIIDGGLERLAAFTDAALRGEDDAEAFAAVWSDLALLIEDMRALERQREALLRQVRAGLSADALAAEQAVSRLQDGARVVAATLVVFLVLSLLVPMASQAWILRQIRARLIQLERYADGISRERFAPPPFTSRDHTGRLALRLALMGRRLRRLLRVARRQTTLAETARREAEQLASYDPLTGLENRRSFFRRLEHAVLRVQQGQERGIALMFLDLDNFKDVNDALGHQAGDDLLREVAARLRSALRSEDSLGRLGGDEFAVLAYHQKGSSEQLVERVRSTLAEPARIGGHDIHITASIGIAHVGVDGDSPQELLRRADLAMYRAKMLGRNRAQAFSQDMEEAVRRHLDLGQELRRGLEEGHFRLYYQAKIDLATGQVVGFEGLLRWPHPERGMIFPDHFIPVAEQTGLIVPIGAQVLRLACEQGNVLIDRGFRVPMAVNVSGRQFYDSDLVATVREVLDATGYPADMLEMEITESMLLEDIDSGIATLRGLGELGVRIALDDFGTGYSSLSYLRRLPLDVLKVDRSFITHVTESAQDAEVVGAIIALAHRLGLKVVAEGVETADHAARLRELGCDVAQGYYYARPVPFEDIDLSQALR